MSKDHKSSKDTFDLETLFKEWHSIKRKMSDLKDREDDIKKIVTKIMKMEDTKTLSAESFEVEQRSQKRKTISKADMPSDIFEKYAKTKEIKALYLKKI